MKYCVDCRYIQAWPSQQHPQCGRYAKEASTEDPVHGRKEWRELKFCEHQRRANGDCGPEAKGFEQRTPLQYFKDDDRSIFDRVFGRGHWV